MLLVVADGSELDKNAHCRVSPGSSLCIVGMLDQGLGGSRGPRDDPGLGVRATFCAVAPWPQQPQPLGEEFGRDALGGPARPCGPRAHLTPASSAQVPICSDHPEAKRAVSEMVQAMGFMPVDMGSLVSAREVEAMPLRLLPGWKVPALLALGLFAFFYVYNFIRDVLQPYVRDGKSKFYKLPVSVVNTTLPCVAYVLLSLVYLPGVLAAALQLRRGTKYRCFPDWLDHWLQHRKQIGLLSFFCAALHALYSFCLPLSRVNRYEVVNLAIKQVRPARAAHQRLSPLRASRGRRAGSAPDGTMPVLAGTAQGVGDRHGTAASHRALREVPGAKEESQAGECGEAESKRRSRQRRREVRVASGSQPREPQEQRLSGGSPQKPSEGGWARPEKLKADSGRP